MSNTLVRTANWAVRALPGDEGDYGGSGAASELERFANMVHLKEPGMFPTQCVNFLLHPFFL
jgi:hypothetical protein